MVKYKGLEVDRRVGIAMTVLSSSQRQAVEKVISSPGAFGRAAALPGRVRMLRTSGQPLFMMRVSPTLRLVYTKVGQTVYVVDLIEKKTLDTLAARKGRKAPPAAKPSGVKTGTSPAAAEK